MREANTPQPPGIMGESCGVGRDESDPGHGQAGRAFARESMRRDASSHAVPTDRIAGGWSPLELVPLLPYASSFPVILSLLSPSPRPLHLLLPRPPLAARLNKSGH